MQRLVFAIAAFVLAIGGGVARAADDVVIGALYPMTGPNAQVGNDAKAAMETAAESSTATTTSRCCWARAAGWTSWAVRSSG